MTIEIKTEDFARYGATLSIVLGLCRANPRQNAKQMAEKLRMSDEQVRRYLQELERIGILERIYDPRGVGRPKLVGVKML